MRLLLFEKKDGAFCFSLALPTARELAHLGREYPAIASMLGELDSMTKHKTAELLDELRAFLTANKNAGRLRSAKSIEVRYNDRDFINGPAEGVTGFKIKGVPCAASVEERGVKISLFEGEVKRHMFILGDRYPVDDGELIIHFRTGSGLYDFFFRLEQSLASIKSKVVWVCVES